MKYELPAGHGLSQAMLADGRLMPRDSDGSPSITDVQFDALAAGVGRGASFLCVAPTSTGKTQIGVWGVFTWLSNEPDRRAVYLVTHRALARQKFEELDQLLGAQLFENDPSCVVLASGDTVEDRAGSVPTVPLDAPLLIATYEKYLAMLAGSGARGDMSQYVIICDEVQIIGDATRGRNVEELLTLLRRAGWGQLVALSAVIDAVDASALSDWLGIALVKSPIREKHLLYECRTSTSVHLFDTGAAAMAVQTRPREERDCLETATIVRELWGHSDNLPIVVFCMTVARVYALARELAGLEVDRVNEAGLLLPGLDEDTSAARNLSQMMKVGVAIHTADLRENERRIVEKALKDRAVKVVVSTSTLAAGVNFPLGAVVFDSVLRWDVEKGSHRPLPESEFQNMAGRAGRMGSGHERGRVIYVAAGNAFQQRPALVYLDPDRITRLEPRLEGKAFGQVALHLLSSGLCSTEEDVNEFLLGTFTAYREQEVNAAGLEHWKGYVATAIASLRMWGFVI